MLTSLSVTSDAEVIGVTMIRHSFEAIPSLQFSGGYDCRLFQPGDQAAWAQIEWAAGEFPSKADALAHFQEEFGLFEEERANRCLLLEEPGGRAIGTTTAWHNAEFLDGKLSRLHWVAIHPDHQGKHLGKPLVCAALRLLARHHDRAYLTSQTSSVRAIYIYLDLGFEPYLDVPRSAEAWGMLAESTRHPTLRPFLR